MLTLTILRAVTISTIAIASSALVAAEEPETVMITLRARPGVEQALAKVIARHYDTARRLEMLRDDAPHVTLQGADENARPFFVEILTWRDAAAPDQAPREILAIWKELNELVDARGGRPGLDIVAMRPVAAAAAK